MAKATDKVATEGKQQIMIKPPRMGLVTIGIEGTTPYSMHKFSSETAQTIEDAQTKGGAKKRGQRPPRKPQEEMEAAIHRAKEGWIGMPAAAFRNASISACRLCGFPMTRAKMTIFVRADGFSDGGTALVRMLGSAPKMNRSQVRLESGVVSLAYRPLWEAGEWGVVLNMEFDEEQFSADDVVNLIARVGLQAGIGEGRPDSKNSNGIGWGLFRVCSAEELIKKFAPSKKKSERSA